MHQGERTHTHTSTALTLMERDHNKLFSVCLMGCERECVSPAPALGLCVYRQTVASVDAHKRGQK